MTLQDLLPQKAKTEQKAEQLKKTEALIKANKAAAALILKGALAQMERNTSTSTITEKRIWI